MKPSTSQKNIGPKPTTTPPASTLPAYSELDTKWLAQFQDQRAIIHTEIQHRYGYTLTSTESDIPYLQHLVADRVYGRKNLSELYAIGLCFGDIFATTINLKWLIVTDEWGTYPTLYNESNGMRVNAYTMISKRIEDSRDIYLQRLYSDMKEFVLSGKPQNK